MIEPERILYYFENVALLLGETEPQVLNHEWSPQRLKGVRELMRTFYKFCHVGTQRLHKCEHLEWEAEFLDAEKALADSGWMKSWEQRDAEVMREGYKAFASLPGKRGV